MLSIKNGELVYLNGNTYNEARTIESLYDRGNTELKSKELMSGLLGKRGAQLTFEHWIKEYNRDELSEQRVQSFVTLHS